MPAAIRGRQLTVTLDCGADVTLITKQAMSEFNPGAWIFKDLNINIGTLTGQDVSTVGYTVIPLTINGVEHEIGGYVVDMPVQFKIILFGLDNMIKLDMSINFKIDKVICQGAREAKLKQEPRTTAPAIMAANYDIPPGHCQFIHIASAIEQGQVLFCPNQQAQNVLLPACLN